LDFRFVGIASLINVRRFLEITNHQSEILNPLLPQFLCVEGPGVLRCDLLALSISQADLGKGNIQHLFAQEIKEQISQLRYLVNVIGRNASLFHLRA
jgi:hypothetical protein